MTEQGEFFFNGIEVGYVKGFGFTVKSESESIPIYKTPRNEGKINVGGVGEEVDVTIDSVDYDPIMQENLWNACKAMRNTGTKAPLVANLEKRVITFKNANNAEWSEDGDPNKPMMVGLKFGATIADMKWK